MHCLGPVGSPFPHGAIWSPATFLQFSFLPINDHIMFRWQQQPLPTSKGNSKSFWFLRKIPQQKRKSWALSCQPALLNYQQILHQWPRKSLEKYCFINPRSHSYHLENETHSFLSLRKKSSSNRIQRAILTKRLKRPFLRNPETRFGVRKIVSILHVLYLVSLDFHPGCTSHLLNLTLSYIFCVSVPLFRASNSLSNTVFRAAEHVYLHP